MRITVGVDVGATSVEWVFRKAGKNSKAERVAQSPQGHAALIKRLQALAPVSVVMEATGIYYLDLAVALHDAGLPVSVINPKSFKHFAALKLDQAKTDAQDAGILAEFGDRMTPALWTPPDAQRLALRDIGRQINRLTAARTQAKNRLHALQAKQMTMPLLLEDEREGIVLLDRRIARLQQAAVALIEQDETLQRQLQQLCTAKGIALSSGIAILGEFCVLPSHLKAPQVSRYAGLDVRVCQSGTSVNRPGKLSKAGNAYLRAALYMPAMSAIQWEPRAKAFYTALVGRGKKKMQALCAVMRKYLTGLWACIQKNTPFDSSRLFSDIHLMS
jgi:transposase